MEDDTVEFDRAGFGPEVSDDEEMGWNEADGD
jgi:hypothetical protein